MFENWLRCMYGDIDVVSQLCDKVETAMSSQLWATNLL